MNDPLAPFPRATALAARVAEIQPFQVMEVQTAARRLEAQGRSVVHMEIGEPDFPTPPQVVEAARDWLAAGRVYYTSALGIAPLREAIARFYRTRFGVEVSPERIVVTTGSSAALLLALALIVDRDDEILLSDPGYPCNRHFVRTLEGRPVAVPVDADSHYQLDAQAIRRRWGPRTRGALIATPSNPTGTTVPPDELARIAATVRDLGGTLLVDEIYQGLSYDGEPRTVLSVTDEVFVVNSFSKYFNMTGWRLGWLVAPARHVRDLEKLAQNLFISAPAPSQHAALACFEASTLALLEERRRAFRARRDFLVPALRELGFGIPLTPAGGFFVYADCSAFSRDSRAFCAEVIEATGVAFTPGIDFGEHRANEHVRFAYTVALESLREGAARLRAHLRR